MPTLRSTASKQLLHARRLQRLGTRRLSLVTGCCIQDGSALGHAMLRARDAKRSQERLGTRCPYSSINGCTLGHARPKPCDQLLHARRLGFRARDAKGTRCQNAHRSVLAHDAHSLIGCCTHDGGSTLGHAMPRARNAKRSQERLGTRCLLL
jgi:hypothetical protein